MFPRRDRLRTAFSMVLLNGVLWPKVAGAAAASLKLGWENPENRRKSNPDTRLGMDSLQSPRNRTKEFAIHRFNVFKVIEFVFQNKSMTLFTLDQIMTLWF